MSDTKRDLQRNVESVAVEVDAIAAGRLWVCHDCGNERERDTAPRRRCKCGGKYEQANMYEYICNSLDVSYTISSQGDLLGGEVTVAFGGPTVWIDTRANKVEGSWGGERAWRYINSDTAGEIDDTLEEMYLSIK